MPPPVAPPLEPSFHTVSALIAPVLVLASSRVPPQASAYGLDAGESQWFLPSVSPSLLPPSPAATVTVTPSAAASDSAWSRAVRDCADQVSSGPPQLMLMTIGVGLAWAASLIASMKAWSVLGPKYTTWAAPGATDPATSMSSSTSPSAPDGSPGVLDPPSTLAAVIVGTDR